MTTILLNSYEYSTKKYKFAFMMLANYINDLLYRYDCVIVPNFGGFITNKIGAKVSNNTHTFYPPSKQVTFNTHLKHNDGLLANYIASAEKISFDKATEKIAKEVANWQDKLTTSPVTVASVGKLSLNNENQLVFEPNKTTNFLTSSFGLASLEATAIERYKEEVKTFEPVTEEEEKKVFTLPKYTKYVASVAVLAVLGFTGYNIIDKQQQEEFLAKERQKVEQKIQKATFVIDAPLPTINLSVAKNTKAFHVIAGAFQLEENAQKKVAELQEKGFDAEILGKNKWGLTQVSYGSYETDAEARKVLENVRDIDTNEAWLLVKKFD